MAYIIKMTSKMKPAIVETSKTRSLGLDPVMTSHNKNMTWPPSNAGIGNKLMKASNMDRVAVIFQNRCQSQVFPYSLPIEMKLPKESFAFILPLKICPNAFILSLIHI